MLGPNKVAFIGRWLPCTMSQETTCDVQPFWFSPSSEQQTSMRISWMSTPNSQTSNVRIF